MYGTLWGNNRFVFFLQTQCYIEKKQERKALEGFSAILVVFSVGLLKTEG